MITSTIGRIFLQAYNEEYGTNYDARSFFKEVFYPLFFEHDKYMMVGGNSPLENPKIKWDLMLQNKMPYETEERRKVRYSKFIEKIESNEVNDSVARGYAGQEAHKATSSQVTNIKLPIQTDDVYLSWVGDALGVGVKGGNVISFFNKRILLDIFEGWKYYRQILNGTKKLKGNQVNTWNGQWLTHYYDKIEYDADNPIADFYSYDINKENGIMQLKTKSWTDVLINISENFENAQIMGYIYKLSNSNMTIGFIPFDLTQIRKPNQFYQKIFGMKDGRKVNNLWGTEFGLMAACENGAIGIKAMEPQGLRDYIFGKKIPKAPKGEEQEISFKVYQIWILAMLKNEDLWKKSEKLASILKDASVDKKKIHSTKPQNLVDNVLKATNKKQFVNAMIDVVEYVPNKEEIKNVVKDITDMPGDNVPYFLTLVRFQYVF